MVRDNLSRTTLSFPHPVKSQLGNWGWSSQIIHLLEDAVNNNLYNLAELNYLELLALANKYPNSLFTNGCKEYAKFTDDTYFGASGSHSVLRQPFIPQKEIDFWPKFIEKYPGHPGSNDALYRLSRAYEVQGDYENSIINYYKASEAPDGDLSQVALARILFIVDMLMSSETLDRFLTNYKNHPLTPYIKYAKAVHLIREYKYSFAEYELNDFLKTYQKGKYQNLWSIGYGTEKPYLDSSFWKKVNEQLEQVKKLAEIRNQKQTDTTLYKEAKLWIDTDKIDDGFTAYNYLWGGDLRKTYDVFNPKKWEGSVTYITNIVTSDFINKSQRNYESQISYLISIKLFQNVIEKYPHSELIERTKYSIALNYYYLWSREYPTLSNEITSWETATVNSFEEFIREFPNSSMADDALYTIAYVKSRNKNINSQIAAYETLQKILKDYPNGDVKKQAEKMIKTFQSQSKDSNRLGF